MVKQLWYLGSVGILRTRDYPNRIGHLGAADKVLADIKRVLNQHEETTLSVENAGVPRPSLSWRSSTTFIYASTAAQIASSWKHYKYSTQRNTIISEMQSIRVFIHDHYSALLNVSVISLSLLVFLLAFPRPSSFTRSLVPSSTLSCSNA